MRVRVTAACKVAYDGQVLELAENDIRAGELAEYLASTGAPVEVLENEPAAPRGRGKKTAETSTANTAGATGGGQEGQTPPNPDLVPEGSVEVVLAWVNEDPAKRAERAGAALAVEQARKTPRAKLVTALQDPATN